MAIIRMENFGHIQAFKRVLFKLGQALAEPGMKTMRRI
tara:strand:- start:277 stop:390 length:114 start_codon:yes stop_codon:yes gene_type:complete